MVRLGLRLTLHSGREALARLAVTTLAVALGTALLLAVLAEFHAFQQAGGRPCWECTTGAVAPRTLPAHGDLWNYSADFYRGRTIERLDVAALGPHPALPPGVSRLPAAGHFDVSPALAALLRTVPRDELGDRFPGTRAGVIGDRALTGPADLVIYVGYRPAALAEVPGTVLVTRVDEHPQPQVFTPYFRYAFATGVLAVLFPVLILISTATRLAAARRAERFAALRLVGATPRDTSVIASVDAVVGALLGVVCGIGVFTLAQPALAGAALTATRYFPATATPTPWAYLGLLVGVPLAAALASLLSLRRVRVSPLGVSRRVAPPRPSPWRLVPLLAGLVLFGTGLALTTARSLGAPAYPGLLLVLIGLVVGGPWLTAAMARLGARMLPGSSALLALRRLADSPQAAFRAVRGLVLAVFLGTMVGVLVPAIDSVVATPRSTALSDVLLDTFGYGPGMPTLPGTTPAQAARVALGLPPQAGARLVRALGRFRGADVFPLYSLPGVANPNDQDANVAVIPCAALRRLAVLGQCAPGVAAVQAQDQSLVYDDNPRLSTAAFVTSANPPYTGRLASLSLQAVLVQVNSAPALERVRTYLAAHAPPATSFAPGARAVTPPRTYAEVVAIRYARAALAERLFYLAVALTILVAGCSLAVSAAGALVDRKRPFTLLRVTGTPAGTLYRVVLLESAVPLLAASLVAAATAYGMSVLAVVRMTPPGTAVPLLGHAYFATIGAGLAASLLVIALTLPLLRRMTSPAGVRFE